MGAMALLLICLSLYLAPILYEVHYKRPPEDFSVLKQEIADVQRTSPSMETPNKLHAPKIIQLTEFDPNRADARLLQSFGLSEKTVQSICRYREKGGVFRKPADLAKIYTLKDADYQRLLPYIRIPTEAPAPVKTYADAPKPVQYAGFSYPEWKPKTAQNININTAGIDDWMRLPGIGEKRARQILLFRDALGGFLNINQVGETYNMPDSIFQKIKGLLIPDEDAMAKIDINSASEEQIARHPYISEKQAKLIIAYREQHGPYPSLDALDNIVVFKKEQAWLSKIKPYLKT